MPIKSHRGTRYSTELRGQDRLGELDTVIVGSQDAGSRNLLLGRWLTVAVVHIVMANVANGRGRRASGQAKSEGRSERKCEGTKHCTRGFRPQKFMTKEGAGGRTGGRKEHCRRRRRRNFLSSLRREGERERGCKQVVLATWPLRAARPPRVPQFFPQLWP